MPKATIRALVASEKPLITPLAHDAITARLIERAGFRAIGVGGSGLLASRYGLPDIGLAALGEMLAGIRDIIAATDLPLMVDGDDGYGDVKSVAHMIETFVRIGVSAVVLEDQMLAVKQPGDAGAVGVVPVDVMTGKIKTAVAAAAGSDLTLVARCDAYKLEGLAGAMRRGERYLAAGADGLFIPGLATVADLKEVGRAFNGKHLMIAQFEGRETWLPPRQLYELGFRQVVYPGLIFQRVVACIDQTLQDLSRFAAAAKPMPAFAAESAQRTLGEAVRAEKWGRIAAGQGSTGTGKS